jgi:septal ring factor EnvC (AmiA/AmiB activator)
MNRFFEKKARDLQRELAHGPVSSSGHAASTSETHDVDMTPHAVALKKELDEKETRLQKQQVELDERRSLFESQLSRAGEKLATQEVMEQIQKATQTRDDLTDDIGRIEDRIEAVEKKLKQKVLLPSLVACPRLTLTL